jgi:sulfhydrogenase subunit beta (sulfur reductase)
VKQQTSRDAKAISKDRIVSLIDELIGQYDVLAPVREDGVVRFDQITSGDQALLNFANAKLSPKDVFFPASEVMFSYEGTRVEVPSLAAKRVLFGVRPCDARSFVLLEKVFSAPDYPDVYYLGKRENTYVVGMGCNRPLRTCFCTSVGGGPFNDEGLDVLLSDTGDKYLVEAVSDRGRELLARADWGSAAESDLGQKEQIVRQAEARATSGAVADFAELSQAEDLQEKLRLVYEDSLWDELSQKCLGCAVCAYVCPTCHCFDVVDEGMNDRGRRVRIWDCCQFPLFTLHASGHNPRPSGRERMRQRIMHKFRYFVENFGEIACVGCGRCIVNCPGEVKDRDAQSVPA